MFHFMTDAFAHPVTGATGSTINTTKFSPSRTAVSISWLFIMNPPSPHTAITRRFGYSIDAIITDGRSAVCSL